MWELREREEEPRTIVRFLTCKIHRPYKCLYFYYFTSGSIICTGHLLSAFSESKSMQMLWLER